jgi:hypothetical protein
VILHSAAPLAYGFRLTSPWTVVATGDFNGDSKPDYVLYNTSTRQTAVWYVNNNLFVAALTARVFRRLEKQICLRPFKWITQPGSAATESLSPPFA